MALRRQLRGGAPRPPRGRAVRAFLLIGALSLALPASGPSAGEPDDRSPGVSPAPGVAWTPPPGEVPAPEPAPAIPPEAEEALRRSGGTVTLAQLIELALRHDPRTREAWRAARAAQWEMRAERGAWYPQVDLEADFTRTSGSAFGTGIPYNYTSFTPSVGLTWLLLDGGGRAADVEEARRELIATNWEHNGAIQDVVLDIQTAYYLYSYARSLLQAQESVLEAAQASLDAAEARHAAGVATLADVLQARTALSQARLARETTRREIETVRGSLAIRVGLPPDTSYDVEMPPDAAPVATFREPVERLLEEAQARRPDLAAARSRLLGAEAHVRSVRSEGRPTLDLGLDSGETYLPARSEWLDSYTASLSVRWPVFTGFTHRANVASAREEAERERAKVEGLRQDVTTEVWQDYGDIQVAAARIEAVADLVASAGRSREAASARYRAGAGSILDLLSAQGALADALAQQAGSRADWYLALARLAHDTGALWLSPGPVPPPGGTTEGKEPAP